MDPQTAYERYVDAILPATGTHELSDSELDSPSAPSVVAALAVCGVRDVVSSGRVGTIVRCGHGCLTSAVCLVRGRNFPSDVGKLGPR
eukprot:COSAG05_NODE_2040_length_3651_cov_6.903716_3_plen_87_part_01